MGTVLHPYRTHDLCPDGLCPAAPDVPESASTSIRQRSAFGMDVLHSLQGNDADALKPLVSSSISSKAAVTQALAG